MGMPEIEKSGVESIKYSGMEMPTTRLPNQTFLCSGQVAIWEHQTGRLHPQGLATVHSPPQRGPHTSSSSFCKPFPKRCLTGQLQSSEWESRMCLNEHQDIKLRNSKNPSGIHMHTCFPMEFRFILPEK